MLIIYILFCSKCVNEGINILVGCTQSEPEPGWLDNINGASGIMTPLVVGFLRVMPLSMDKITDIVPVDFTVNALISVMWDTVNRYDSLHITPTRIKFAVYI